MLEAVSMGEAHLLTRFAGQPGSCLSGQVPVVEPNQFGVLARSDPAVVPCITVHESGAEPGRLPGSWTASRERPVFAARAPEPPMSAKQPPPEAGAGRRAFGRDCRLDAGKRREIFPSRCAGWRLRRPRDRFSAMAWWLPIRNRPVQVPCF